MILLPVSTEDLKKLEPILSSGQFAVPNIKLSIYKNRRGRYKSVYLWCNADLGTCRIQPMFATDFRYALTPIENIEIKVKAPWEK